MASPGFLAWLEQKRAQRSARAAEMERDALRPAARSVLDVSSPPEAALPPSPSAKSQQTPRLEQKKKEQSKTTPLSSPKAKEPPTVAVNTDVGRLKKQESAEQPAVAAAAQQSKKRQRSPPATGAEPESFATPRASSSTPVKRRKPSAEDENKQPVPVAASARERSRGLRERPTVAEHADVPDKRAKATPTVAPRTPIPIPSLLPLDAEVDWDLASASMLLEVPSTGPSLLLDERRKKKKRATDAAELERPLNGSDFSFWRAVDRFYDLDEA